VNRKQTKKTNKIALFSISISSILHIHTTQNTKHKHNPHQTTRGTTKGSVSISRASTTTTALAPITTTTKRDNHTSRKNTNRQKQNSNTLKTFHIPFLAKEAPR
jgi:hypothetical protein